MDLEAFRYFVIQNSEDVMARTWVVPQRARTLAEALRDEAREGDGMALKKLHERFEELDKYRKEESMSKTTDKAAFEAAGKKAGLSPAILSLLFTLAVKYGPALVEIVKQIIDDWNKPAPVLASPSAGATHHECCDNAKASAICTIHAAIHSVEEHPDCEKCKAVLECAICTAHCVQCCCDNCPV
jgi:hypothetical protein